MIASLNIVSGKLNWQIKLDGRIESSACLCSCGNYVVVGCYDHHVYAIEISTGSVSIVVTTSLSTSHHFLKALPKKAVGTCQNTVICALHEP